MSPVATLRTRHADAETVAAALAPDNTDEISMQVTTDPDADFGTVVTTIDRETTGGLAATVDDVVVNLAVATQVADRCRPDRPAGDSATSSSESPTDADASDSNSGTSDTGAEVSETNTDASDTGADASETNTEASDTGADASETNNDASTTTASTRPATAGESTETPDDTPTHDNE